MAGPAVVTCLAGAAGSSAGAFAVMVASHAPVEVAVDFAVASGGNGDLGWHRYEGPRGAFVIASGTALPAVGVVERAVTPWLRLRFGAAASSTTSALIVSV